MLNWYSELFGLRKLLSCFSLLLFTYNPAISQSVYTNDPNQWNSNFNVYCDPNGGATGTCTTFDQNIILDCEYASQEFIQCTSRSTKQILNCLYYAPFQFSCQQDVDSKKLPQTTNLVRPNLEESVVQPSIQTKPVVQNNFKPDFLGTFSTDFQ